MRKCVVYFLIFIFNYSSLAIAETYKSKIYSKDDTHIIFKFNSTGNSKKWDNTYKAFKEDAKVHCSNYNKNFYWFRKNIDGQWKGDISWKQNLLSSTIWMRVICAKNVKEAEKLVNRTIKNFRSQLYNQNNLELYPTNTNDASYLAKISTRNDVPSQHANITRDKIVDKYFKNKKLDNIEGIWVRKTEGGTASNKTIDGDDGTLIYIYKDGNKYYSRYLKADYAKKGQLESEIEKISKKYFTAKAFSPSNGQYMGDITYLLSKEGFFYETLKYDNGKTMEGRLVRLYPEYRSGSGSASGKTGASGSAFFVDQKGHLITNEHVVNGCEDNLKISYQNKNYKVKLISKDEVVDLAILKADLSFNEYFELSDEQPQKLQRVIVAGYPLGKDKISDDLKVNLGIISSLKGYKNNTNLIQIDAAVNFGNSGGPVIDEESSKVVGVAVAGLRKDVTEGFNFAIKSSVVKNFIQSSGVELPSSIFNFSFGTSRDQLRKKTENATLYIYCE